jgi:CHAD domain-containing protein
MTEPAEYQPGESAPSIDVSPMLQHLHEVAATMRSMLDACRKAGESPKVEAVHQLRTGTRRVEATLETLAREAGARGLGKAAEETRQRWLRQLKKVRRATGTVRDFDVHRELLAENFLPAAEETKPDAAGSGEVVPLVKQARLLDAWLKARRAVAAHSLRGTLDDHASRLLDAEQQFMAALAKGHSRRSRTQRPAARLALEDYLRLMDAMPLLDGENLHDFRKGAKKARYVAESDDKDQAAVAMGKAIKRVQDVIGEWHDWDVVRGEAREALHDDGAALEAQLEVRTKRAYERALRVTATMSRRFVGEWRTSRPRRAHSLRVTSRKSS